MPRLQVRALAALAAVSSFTWSTAAPAGDSPPAQPPEAAAAGDPTTPPAENLDETIIVTGSRIPRAELMTAAPVTVVSRAQIDSAGHPSIGDILQAIPQQANGLNTQVNNGGDGSIRLNLRGLGSPRTLVLLNGRRFVSGGTGADPGVDLTTIPTFAIQRVEILKDGASAVYGSDAIAGVVNLITRKDYSGAEVSAFYGSSQQGDGMLIDLSAITGLAMEKGNVLISGGFYRQGQVMAGSRSFSKFAWLYDFATGSVVTQGSSATPQGAITVAPAQQDGNATWNALVAANPGVHRFTLDAASQQWRAFRNTGLIEDGGDFYNYQPESYLVTPSQRVNLFAVGEYRFSDSARGYFEASYNHRSSRQQLAAEPLFTLNEGIVVSRDNVYNPFGRDFDNIARRMVETKNRTDTQDQDTFRVVTGMAGQMSLFHTPTPWSFDLSASYGRNQSVWLSEGHLRRSQLANALGPSFQDPATGEARCGRPGNEIEGCVPLDLFGGAGSITEDQAANLTFTGTQRGLNEMLAAQTTVSGTLFQLGPGTAPVELAVGYEVRREHGAHLPDPLTADAIGITESKVEGAFVTSEGYLELSVPVLAEAAPGGQGNGRRILELNGAARVASYDTVGTHLTYRLGGRFSPVRDVNLRGTFSTAFRAPDIVSLFSGTSDSFAVVRDPCSADVPGQSRAQGTPVDLACDANGVPDDHFDDRASLRARVGSNPDLQPETANVLTVGAVLQPRWVKDLSLTVDYSNVVVQGAFGVIGSAVILDSCFPAEAGRKPEHCSLIQRDANHFITNIVDTLTNVGGNRVSSIDLAARYEPRTPLGTFLIDADLTYLLAFTQEMSGGRRVDARGTYDLDGLHPEWKGNLGVAWRKDALRAGARLRYIGSFKECEVTCTVEDSSQPEPLSRQVGPYATVDVNVAYTLATAAGESTLALGVTNLLGTPPPPIYNALVQVDPSYDFYGRYFYARVTHKL
ncbi:MAG TPA: TonB-dependent receptor [Myxococcaceae bacterium]|nr:TonB-dependent receptor [Myxococcaceae bacterium]